MATIQLYNVHWYYYTILSCALLYYPAYYDHNLEESLAQLEIPHEILECRNVRCESIEHVESLNIVTENLLESINKCASQNLCKVGGKIKSSKLKLIPGWKEMVVPYQEQAEFWNFLWAEAGRPRHGSTFKVMQHTKAQYHYAIRRCKRAATEISNDKLVQSLMNGDSDLFEQVKKTRIQNRECASSVDNQKGSENISNLLKNQYEQLYNQQNSRGDMDELLQNINLNMEDREVKEVEKITPDLIKEIFE